MILEEIIFLIGLHRSGTSLLHEILRDHSEIRGLKGTGFPEDEGQYVQDIYPTGNAFGGPGNFAMDPMARMDENHEKANEYNSNRLYNQWVKHCPGEGRYLIEKSPPNILKTRFLRKLFPNSKFLVIVRNPIVVSLATKKWTKKTVDKILDHTLHAYKILYNDLKSLDHYMIIKYEDFVESPQAKLDQIYTFLDLKSVPACREVRPDVNMNYIKEWRELSNRFLGVQGYIWQKKYESEMNKYGYSFREM